MDTLFNEAPLDALPPGASILSPSKPIIEMTDEELVAWHSRLRNHSNHMTMLAHQNEVGVSKAPKRAKKDAALVANQDEFI